MVNLSIIIPYKDIADHLDKLLQSIVTETQSETVQVLVIDDKSTKQLERYKEICETYGDRVTFISNTGAISNAGAARNIGLKNAAGEWLLFADSDDCFVSGWFSIIQSFFGSRSDIVFFTPTSRNEFTKQIGHRHEYLSELIYKYQKNQGEIMENRLRTGFVVPWSKMIRKDFVIQNHFFFDEVMYSNDVMFSVKCGLAAKTFSVSSESIYCAEERSGSLIADKSGATFLQRLSISCCLYHYTKKKLNREQFHWLSVSVLWYSSMYRIIRKRVGKECSNADVIATLKLLQKNHIPADPICLALYIVRRKILHL